VTVLFADVVGSTAMGERLDPELVTDIMNGAFAFMNRAIDRYGGTVARLMGDAVLAIFGAPSAHEDDPERAIRAGLDIQADARRYAADIQRQHAVDFNVRVGIHTGLAVLDRVGDRIHAEYTAMGDTPNVAARMQAAAAPGTVLVSADAYRLTQHAFDFQSRGLIEVKGKSAPIETWQTVGLKAAPTSARGLTGLRAPLVGRETENDRLRARLAALRPSGPGSWVTLSGEAGLGKSRLVAELSQSPPAQEVMWLEGRCISFGRAMSYLPWRQIIRQSLDAKPDDPAEAVRAKLEYSACECCALPGGDLPFLEAMLAVASEASLKTVLGYTGDELVRQMTNAVRGYLCAQASRQPMVIVVEDLHWADEASIGLLENICELVPQHPILVLGVLRPDKDAPAWTLVQRIRQALDPTYQDEIALEPLSLEQSRDLLSMLLQIEDLPARVRSLILEKAEGNPFFVEEVIRSLLDNGQIVREQGYWRATREIETVSIPNTLAGLLAARIDALPDDAKRVAQMAAVLGRSFSFRLIEGVCAAAPPAERLADIAPALGLLERQEIVRVRAHASEQEYTFKHALTQEAAYNSLLLRRRREFHGRAGQALEALYGDRLDELAPSLAHHFWEAEDWKRAAAYAQRAGDAALRVYALREAIRQFDCAVEALDKDGGANEEQLYAATMGWARAALKFRPYAEQLERLARAEQIARRRGDKRRLAETLNAIGAVHVASGHAMRAIPIFTEAFALADDLGDEGLAIVPSFHAALSQMGCDPLASLALFDRAVTLARKYGNPDVEAYARSGKAMALARLGRFAESQAAIDAALGIVRNMHSPVTAADVEMFAGWAYLDMGEALTALEHAQRAVAGAIATDSFDCICGALACVGFGQLQAGQVPEAALSFTDAIKQTELSGAQSIEALARGGLALTQLMAGRPEALPVLEQSAARARALYDPFTAAQFAHAAAEAHLGQGNLDDAQEFLAQALAYFEPNDLRPYLERVRATQAALQARQATIQPGHDQ
jgi:class 3 adenylate cyclase/tetratricopeptide (TPR) repeat protein